MDTEIMDRVRRALVAESDAAERNGHAEESAALRSFYAGVASGFRLAASYVAEAASEVSRG